MLYREYNLDKLWTDTVKVQDRHSDAFTQSYLDDARLRFKDWNKDQQKIKSWKLILDKETTNSSPSSGKIEAKSDL